MNRIEKIAAKIAMDRSPYYHIIQPILTKMGRTDVDPRHVEAYLRLEYGTLDSLSRMQFEKLMPEMVETVDANMRQAENLARSYGL